MGDVSGEDWALTPYAEPGQGSIVVALTAVGALVSQYDTMDEEAVDVAVLGHGQARVVGQGLPTSYPAHSPGCTHVACLHFEAHILAFFRPHILQPPKEQQFCFWGGRGMVAMEPGGAWRLTPCSISQAVCPQGTKARSLGLGLGKQTQGTRPFLPRQGRTSNVESGTCGHAPCSGSHGPRILKLAPPHGQCAA